MASEFLKVTSTDTEWLEISKKFGEKWNFPHALGAIDGKYVKYVGREEIRGKYVGNTWGEWPSGLRR